MYICTACQTENRPSAKFCRRCGQTRDIAAPETKPAASTAAQKPAPELALSTPSEAPRAAGRPSCPNCRSNIRLSDKFCIWCGARQPQKVKAPIKSCPDCQTQLPMSANFCYVCGNGVALQLAKRVAVANELFQEEDPELAPKYEA